MDREIQQLLDHCWKRNDQRSFPEVMKALRAQKDWGNTHLDVRPASAMDAAIVAQQWYVMDTLETTSKEQRALLPFLFATPVLFAIGASFAYFITIPIALKFLLGYQGEIGGVTQEALPSVGNYLSFVMQFIMAFGIAFLLPILLMLIERAGLVTRQQLIGARRYMIVAAFAIAAVFTPPDVMSQLLLAVPLVFSVHSMVALDFSEGLLPGWHSTIFPPFFVAGALFSGAAMVVVLAVILRRAYALREFITDDHLDKLAKMMLAVGWVVTYGYAAEVFTAFYGGDPYEVAMQRHRLSGEYAWMFWATIACNSVSIQALWWPRVRTNPVALVAISLLVLTGMWLERFMLIVTSLYRDFLPSSWGAFHPTVWDAAFLAGSIGLFALMFLIFVRIVPVLSIAELRRHAAERVDRRP